MLEVKSKPVAVSAVVAKERATEPVKRTSMRICMHVIGDFKYDVRARRSATALARNGYAVTVVDCVPAQSRNVEMEDGVQVCHIPVPSTFSATRFKRWAIVRAAHICLLGIWSLWRVQTDVYHALDLPALPACYLVALLRRKAVVFESYELPLATLRSSELSKGRRLLQALLAPLLSYIVPRCAGVIAVSPPIVREMQKRYQGAHITLVRNIPPYQLSESARHFHQLLKLAPSVRVALYQGNIQSDRKLDLLVRTAQYLPDDIVIVLMGKGPEETIAHLQSLILLEGLSERVKIIPPVPYAALLSWTTSADIGLLLYSPDYSLNVQMCLPNKFFEFLMAGLPVLTSQLEAVVEVVEKYAVGCVVPSLAPQDIAQAIHTMLADTNGLEKMRANALYAAREVFNWEKEQQQLLDFYDCLNGRPEHTALSVLTERM